MESLRGRWFLAEYARRNRHADTTMLLKALDLGRFYVVNNELQTALDGRRVIDVYAIDLQTGARRLLGAFQQTCNGSDVARAASDRRANMGLLVRMQCSAKGRWPGA